MLNDENGGFFAVSDSDSYGNCQSRVQVSSSADSDEIVLSSFKDFNSDCSMRVSAISGALKGMDVASTLSTTSLYSKSKKKVTKTLFDELHIASFDDLPMDQASAGVSRAQGIIVLTDEFDTKDSATFDSSAALLDYLHTNSKLSAFSQMRSGSLFADLNPSNAKKHRGFQSSSKSASFEAENVFLRLFSFFQEAERDPSVFVELVRDFTKNPQLISIVLNIIGTNHTTLLQTYLDILAATGLDLALETIEQVISTSDDDAFKSRAISQLLVSTAYVSSPSDCILQTVLRMVRATNASHHARLSLGCVIFNRQQKEEDVLSLDALEVLHQSFLSHRQARGHCHGKFKQCSVNAACPTCSFDSATCTSELALCQDALDEDLIVDIYALANAAQPPSLSLLINFLVSKPCPDILVPAIVDALLRYPRIPLDGLVKLRRFMAQSHPPNLSLLFKPLIKRFALSSTIHSPVSTFITPPLYEKSDDFLVIGGEKFGSKLGYLLTINSPLSSNESFVLCDLHGHISAFNHQVQVLSTVTHVSLNLSSGPLVESWITVSVGGFFWRQCVDLLGNQCDRNRIGYDPEANTITAATTPACSSQFRKQLLDWNLVLFAHTMRIPFAYGMTSLLISNHIGSRLCLDAVAQVCIKNMKASTQMMSRLTVNALATFSIDAFIAYAEATIDVAFIGTSMNATSSVTIMSRPVNYCATLRLKQKSLGGSLKTLIQLRDTVVYCGGIFPCGLDWGAPHQTKIEWAGFNVTKQEKTILNRCSASNVDAANALIFQ